MAFIYRELSEEQPPLPCMDSAILEQGNIEIQDVDISCYYNPQTLHLIPLNRVILSYFVVGGVRGGTKIDLAGFQPIYLAEVTGELTDTHE